jgi:hypothetical protein
LPCRPSLITDRRAQPERAPAGGALARLHGQKLSQIEGGDAADGLVTPSIYEEASVIVEPPKNFLYW